MIVIQCATPKEFGALRTLLKEAAFSDVVLQSGLGVKEARKMAEKAIKKLKPQLIIDFGAAGALVESLKPGALVAATEVIDFSVVPHIQYRTARFESLAKSAAQLVWGPLAAAEQNIETRQERQKLAKKTGAMATCWEAAAIAAACEAARVDFISVRFISDQGERDLRSEYLAGIQTHLNTAARALVQLVARLKDQEQR